MKDKFVTYPIALMLKELGYDEECLASFEGNTFGLVANYTKCKNSLEATEVTAPLWQDAIDWLADEHKIYIGVKFADKAFTMYEFCIYRTFEELVQCAAISAKLGDNKPTYRSKFKAREAAILKAIEIIKKK